MQTLLSIALVVLAAAARLIPGPRPVDDAFITFRYALNILSGAGFVYNPGEHVLGTTTPVYTLLMTVLGGVFGSSAETFPWIALGVSTLADAATCLLLWRTGVRLKAPGVGLACGLIWAVAPYSVTFAIGGMETSVYIFLLAATVFCYLQNRKVLWPLLAAGALLTRPDAALLLGLLFIDRLMAARKDPARRITVSEVLAFAIPVLAWALFSLSYFGSMLPHSISAKAIAYRLPGNAGLIRLLQHYATPFHEDQTFGIPGIAVGLFLYPFLFAVGARRALRVEPRIWPFLVYPWVYFAAFALSGVLMFRWYLSPPLPAYFLGILLGASELLRRILAGMGGILSGRISRKNPGGRPNQARSPNFYGAAIPVLLLAAIPLTSIARSWTLHPDHGPDRPAPVMAWIQVEMLYREAVQAIKPSLQPGDVIAAGDVGVVGFTSSAEILDLVGLNSPKSLDYYPLDPGYYVINYAVPPRLIADLKPDYVIILEVYGREGLLKDDGFIQSYRLLHSYPTDIYGSDGLLVFQRVE